MEEKSSSLFMDRTERPQLEVNRLLKLKSKEEKEVMCVKQHVELKSSFDIMALKKVRTCYSKRRVLELTQGSLRTFFKYSWSANSAHGPLWTFLGSFLKSSREFSAFFIRFGTVWLRSEPSLKSTSASFRDSSRSGLQMEQLV